MTIEELQVVIKAQTSGLKKELENVNKSLNKMSSNTQNATNKMNKSFAGVGKVVSNLAKAIAALGVIKIGIEGVNELNAAQAALSSLNRTLGEETTDALQKWSDEVARNFGFGRGEALKTAMFMGNILKGFIDPSDVSQATTQLIGQMAVMSKATGKSMDVIQESIQSAFLGSFERVENIIPTMTRSLANQYAQTYYNVDAFAKLNQEQQKFVMYQMIMAESMTMYGNSLTPAMVSMLQLQATLQDLKLQFGAAFATILQIVMPVIQAIANGLTWLVAIIAGVADAIAGLFGKSSSGAKNLVNEIQAVKPAASASAGLVDNVANALGVASKQGSGLADSLKESERNAKKLKGSLMGFDEINTLNMDDGGAGSVGSLGSLPDINIPSLGGVTTDLGNLGLGLDGNLEKFNAFSGKLEEIKQKAKIAFETIVKVIKKVTPYVVGITAAIAGVFAVSGIARFFNVWDDLFEGASDDVLELAANGSIVDGVVGKVKKSGSGLKGAFAGFGLAVQNELAHVSLGFAGILNQIPIFQGAATAMASMTTGTLAVIGAAIIAVVAAIAGAFVDLALNNAEFQASWKTVWENIKTTCSNVWNNIIKPVLEAIVVFLVKVWENGLKPLWNAWVEIWGEISGIITDILNGVVFPILNTLMEFLGPIIGPVLKFFASLFADAFNNVLAIVTTVFKQIKTVFETFRGILNGIIDFVKGVFTGNWRLAFQGLSKIIESVFNGMKSLVKTPLNFIIDMVNKAIKGINKMTSFVSKIPGVDIPDVPSIPRLARGGIVDSGQMFMAGEAGKEAIVPLEHNTQWAKNIGQLLAKELRGSEFAGSGQSNRPIEITLSVGSTQFGRAVVDSYNQLSQQEGRLLFNL